MILHRSGLLVLVAAAVASGQGPGRGSVGAPGPMAAGLPPDMRIIGAMPGRLNRVVKNAPYSAEAVTETTQTLPDGNHIRQSSRAKLYRDSEGRERNEQSMDGLRALAPGSNLPPVVYINDPVAGVDFALDGRDKAATRYTRPQPGAGRQQAASGRGAPAGARRGQADNAAQQGSRGPQGGRWGRGERGSAASSNVKTESLGRQTIEGVPADGARTTITVPAGSAYGNELPIQIVSETWYSTDLQAAVLTRHSDPRSGETTFRLVNITRAEPPAALFRSEEHTSELQSQR